MNRPYPWERTYPTGLGWDLAPAAHSLPAVLARSLARHGEQTFLDYRDVAISYAQFGQKAYALAAGLLRLGLQPGQRVALYLPNTPYHPYSFFGVLVAGGVVVHLSPLDAPRELEHKLQDSGARLLITTNIGQMPGVAENLLRAGHIDRIVIGDDAAFGPALGLPVTKLPTDNRNILDFTALLDAPIPSAWPPVDAHDVAVLQYTGGTTGLPKGVMHTHATLNAAVAIGEHFLAAQDPDHEKASDRVIVVLPLFHIYALSFVLIWQMQRGSVLLLHLRFDVQAVLRDIEVKRATHFPGVPTMWIALNALADIDKRDFSSLKHVGSGGAPLPPEVAHRFERKFGKRLAGGWGMTETASAGTGHLITGMFKDTSIGLPLPGIEVQIVSLDDPCKLQPMGEIGELRIKGPNVFKGYWNQPQESAAAFVDGYFLTGDIGRMDADGMVYLVDRKKDMIICGGFNVYPRVIEDAIYEHPDVEEVCVIGLADEYRGQAAKAFIKLKSGGGEFSLEYLQAFLADKIGRHEIPKALEFRQALPKTSVGKLSKKELIVEETGKANQEARKHG